VCLNNNNNNNNNNNWLLIKFPKLNSSLSLMDMETEATEIGIEVMENWNLLLYAGKWKKKMTKHLKDATEQSN